MANFFLDVSAVGNEYQAYADTPASWGVPQDGNGKAASAASAAVAVATIDVAGCTASGTGTIGVFGITASNTLNASGSALATAIAAAINAATGAVTSTFSALLLPLNRLVYARVNPVTNTRVDIMLRIAGTDWNTMTPTQSNISPAATITSFTGGVNGPFGYLAAQSAVFGKAVLNGYGVHVAKVAGVTDPGGTDDTIYIRTARSGANVVSGYLVATSTSANMPAARCYMTDHGAIWSGDDGVFIWDIYQNNSGYFSINNQGFSLAIIGQKQGAFKIKWRHNNGAYPLSLFGTNTNLRLVNCDLETYDSVSRIALTYQSPVAGAKAVHESCRFYIKGNNAVVVHSASGYGSSTVTFYNCEFYWTGVGSTVSAVLSGGGPASARKTEFYGCKFDVDNGNYELASILSNASLYYPASSSYGGNSIVVADCTGLTNSGATISAHSGINNTYFLLDDSKSGKGFRYTTPQFSTEWVNDGTYPVLNAQNQDGSSIAVKILWRYGAFGASPCVHPVRVMKFNTFYKGVQGTKKVTLELLTPTAEVPTTYDMFLMIKYIDKDNIARFEFTQGIYKDHLNGAGTSLDSSSASWTLNGVTGVEARKIELAATTYQIKSNSEVSAHLFFGDGPASVDRTVYVNPEIAIS